MREEGEGGEEERAEEKKPGGGEPEAVEDFDRARGVVEAYTRRL